MNSPKSTSFCLISTESSAYFADLIARHFDPLRAVPLPVERLVFGGVESYYRIQLENRFDLLGKQVVIVASTHSDGDLLELTRVASACHHYGAAKIICVIPFLGYSTMERAVLPGEIVTAKTVARQLSTLPGNQHFLFMDLHVSGLLHYFEGDCRRYELYAEPNIIAALSKDETIGKGGADLVFASADLGRPKWVEAFARTFDTDLAFIRKTRNRSSTQVESVIGTVTDKRVIIYDDMTRTAGSLIKAASAYLRSGAISVSAVVSHLALNSPSVLQALEDSPIERLWACNTHPSSNWPAVMSSSKVKLIDVSDIFADIIDRLTSS